MAMQIKTLSIKNYRVFKNVTIADLPRLTALVGTNGSGKSTFFDVFSFIKDALTHNVSKAVSKRGGFKELVSRDSSGPISISIQFRETKGRLATYELEVDAEDGKAFRLVALCTQGGRPDTLVRIACQELEAWYLGDLDSLKRIYGLTVSVNQNKQLYRNPDLIGSPKAEVKRLANGFQKTDGARRLGVALNPKKNQSNSFKMLVAGIEKVSGQSAITV